MMMERLSKTQIVYSPHFECFLDMGRINGYCLPKKRVAFVFSQTLSLFFNSSITLEGLPMFAFHPPTKINPSPLRLLIMADFDKLNGRLGP